MSSPQPITQGVTPPRPPAPRRLSLILILLAGALVFSSAVRSDFLLDDYMHASMVEGNLGIKRGLWDIYDFVKKSEWPDLFARGLLPWWSAEHLEIRFLRPLSSLLRALELRHMGGEAGTLPMHLHSLLWWMACVVAVRSLFVRNLAPRQALLATFIFALGPWHVLPIGWLANREVLLSIAFGAPALIAYCAWRAEGRARDGLLATLGFTAAFASGEYAICFGGYVLAREVLYRGEPLLRRALRFFPFVLPALGYLLVHALLGYGTRGSSFYADPLHEPGKLLARVPGRLMVLIAEGWLTIGTEPWGTTAPRWALGIGVAAAIAVLAVALCTLAPRLVERERATVAWLLLGSLGAIVPVLAAAPGPRLLSVSAIGIAAVSAVLIDAAWFPRAGSTPSFALGAAAIFLAFFQLVHGPLSSVVASETLRVTSQVNREATDVLAQRLRARGQDEVVVMRGGGSAFFAPFALAARGVRLARYRVLSQTVHVLALTRDDHTLEVVASDLAPIYPEGATNLFRDERRPLRAGDVIEQSGLRAEVLQVAASGPTRVRFHFDDELSAPSRAFIDETFVGLAPVELPSEGFGAPFDP